MTIRKKERKERKGVNALLPFLDAAHRLISDPLLLEIALSVSSTALNSSPTGHLPANSEFIHLQNSYSTRRTNQISTHLLPASPRHPLLSIPSWPSTGILHYIDCSLPLSSGEKFAPKHFQDPVFVQMEPPIFFVSYFYSHFPWKSTRWPSGRIRSFPVLCYPTPQKFPPRGNVMYSQ